MRTIPVVEIIGRILHTHCYFLYYILSYNWNCLLIQPSPVIVDVEKLDRLVAADLDERKKWECVRMLHELLVIIAIAANCNECVCVSFFLFQQLLSSSYVVRAERWRHPVKENTNFFRLNAAHRHGIVFLLCRWYLSSQLTAGASQEFSLIIHLLLIRVEYQCLALHTYDHWYSAFQWRHKCTGDWA